jgi:hypothetical protein
MRIMVVLFKARFDVDDGVNFPRTVGSVGRGSLHSADCKQNFSRWRHTRQ